MFDAATTGEFVQHLAVSLVALAALFVVLRRVVGVFDRRPVSPAGGAAPTAAAAPGCSHCASGPAAVAGKAGRPGPA